MTTRRFDAALFGPVFVDHVMTGFARWPLPGEEACATGYRREAGGGCANTACGLSALGSTAACFASVGRDDGRWLLDRIAGFGVDVAGARLSPLPTAITLAVSLEGERSFFTYGGANAELAGWLEEPDLASRLAQARHVHFAHALPAARGLGLVRQLHAAGCTVSLDSGWREDWLRDPASWTLVRELDLFLPNESEAALMTGEAAAPEMLRVFASQGIRAVALKLGPRGAMLCDAADGGAPIWKPAIDVEVVDTTGAGDAFDAGFLHAWIAGQPGAVCLERAVICGSLSARRPGSLEALPSWNEVQEYHANYANW